MKKLAILGSTGSIGQNCLKVVDSFPGEFQIISLSAGGNLEVLATQIARYHPEVVSIRSGAGRGKLRGLLQSQGAKVPEILDGPSGLMTVGSHPSVNLLVSATVGVAGLRRDCRDTGDVGLAGIS